MEKKYDLSTIFGNVSDVFNDLFEEFDLEPKTFFLDNSWMKPKYSLKDKDDKYVLEVEYDDAHDEAYVRTDKKRNLILVSVYEDWKKSSGISSRVYYGRFAFTAPEDCDLETLEKTIDKENKKMIISFDKVKKEEDKKKETDNEAQDTLDYKALYNKLLGLTNKFEEKIKALDEKNDELKKENEELTKKLNNIKNLFN